RRLELSRGNTRPRCATALIIGNQLDPIAFPMPYSPALWAYSVTARVEKPSQMSDSAGIRGLRTSRATNSTESLISHTVIMARAEFRNNQCVTDGKFLRKIGKIDDSRALGAVIKHAATVDAHRFQVPPS